jgi:cation:H+ antiporter
VSDRLPALGWIGLSTPLLIGLYFVAMRVVFSHERQRALNDSESGTSPVRARAMSLRAAIVRYAAAAVVVVGAAIWLPHLGSELARQTGLGQAFVGSLFVAITTSLPEIVVSLAAVRMGAVDLGVANVLGSNMFNLLILGLDDVFYLPGPLLEHASPAHAVIVAAIVMMNACDHQTFCRCVGHRGDRRHLCTRVRTDLHAEFISALRDSGNYEREILPLLDRKAASSSIAVAGYARI